ncbi:MAG: 50S ribosomal protein L18 [Patescibacteria group bacterium]
MLNKRKLRQRRKFRIRAKIRGTARRPRLAVFRSNKALAAQLIDDEKHVTLVGARCPQSNKVAAHKLGSQIAAAAKKQGITQVVFDRGGYRYHGAIRELAEAVREGGLKF